jgi:hypothetical protein|tara:strand:+ start:694 stop:942 length:249 start_codon:yes stop_codon:yes gene_type:complete
MAALMINQSTTSGRATYTFTSRGTLYTIITRECGELFEVISERKSASFGMQIVVMTLKEMAARSKALTHLCTIISAGDAARA